jgi:hypothetical protein
MTKELITRNKLQQWLTTEIQKEENFEQCRFKGITKLAEPDCNGCNWTTSFITSVNLPDSTVDKVVLTAKQRFIVVD